MDTDFPRKLKIVVIGNKGVGKTSMLMVKRIGGYEDGNSHIPIPHSKNI